MEPLTETVDLDIDESNELAFKIKLEGASASPAKVRLVCEGEDFSYMFNGYGTPEPEVVQFTLPRMSSKIHEGVYSARIEVLVENRYFAPLQFQLNFKKTLNVVAESIKVTPKSTRPEITVTAAPIVVAKPQSAAPIAAAPIRFEQRPEAKPQAATHRALPDAPRPSASSSLREAYLKKTSQASQTPSTDKKFDADTLRKMAREILRSKLDK